ncbi:MAG: hypothetical protein H0V63_05495 [Burkholderiaceae bacterium]|nr:hypothetical protein [Burkholderiaceae bacterium]
MNDRSAFSEAMAALGVNFRVEVSDAQRDLYWTVLADMPDVTFQVAVRRALKACRFFPTIAELCEQVTPTVIPAAEAAVAFEQVVKAGRYNPTIGTCWGVERVREQVGDVAAEAFVAAGASPAFESEQDTRSLPFLRKRFIEAYVLAATALRSGRPLALATGGTLIDEPEPTTRCRLTAGPDHGVVRGA